MGKHEQLEYLWEMRHLSSPLPDHRRQQQCIWRGPEGPGASHHCPFCPLYARDRPLHDRVYESGALRLWMARLVMTLRVEHETSTKRYILHYTLYSNMMWANTESAACSLWPACFRWPDVLQHSRWTPNDLQRPGCLLQWLCVRWSISWKVWV